jgi:glycosyltransferase involved in cell wall biosynthesis
LDGVDVQFYDTAIGQRADTYLQKSVPGTMTGQMPLVTVIIPTRNRLSLTAEAIGSVQAQTYSNWELNLVDDASDDGSAGQLRSLAEHDPRIHVIALKERGGQSRARQIGLEHSSAPLIAPLDSDDLWLPEKLATQVTYLLDQSQREPTLGVVRCRSQWVNFDGEPVQFSWRPFRAARRRTAFPVAFGNMSVPLFTAQALRAAGGFESPQASRLTNAEHIEFALRQMETSESATVDRVLVICRNHPTPRGSDSLGTRAAAEGLARALELHDGFRKQYPHLAAALMARTGARYLDAGDPIGYRYLSRAVRRSGLRGGGSLILRYAPFAIRKLPTSMVASRNSGSA